MLFKIKLPCCYSQDIGLRNKHQTKERVLFGRKEFQVKFQFVSTCKLVSFIFFTIYHLTSYTLLCQSGILYIVNFTAYLCATTVAILYIPIYILLPFSFFHSLLNTYICT